MSNAKLIFCGSDKQYLKEELTKDSNISNGGNAFRIPSLVNANGTLIAAIDKATTGMDWGYIELAIRTSSDKGKTWSDIKTIASPPAREISTDKDNTKTAFFIDPCMAVAPNGDVILLATFFPECKGIHDKRLLDKHKFAYASFDSKRVPVIYDRDGNFYYVLEDGTVINKSKHKTAYKVKGLGELYKDSEYIGNIYLNGAMKKSSLEDKKTTFGAPLKAPKRSYIFMMKSSDNGLTWSEPKDITSNIINEDIDGQFFAIAPGAGLTTKNGRIIIPIYTLKGTVAIYSDDNGLTWTRNFNQPYTQNVDEWCAIEAPNGEIFSFGRAKFYGKTPVSKSMNNGIFWAKDKKADFKAPKCQKSAIAIGKDIFVSHPNSKKRENGIITQGKFITDRRGNFKRIKWSNYILEINQGFFAYSCLAQVDEHTLGVLYEDEPSSHIMFKTFEI